MDGRYRPMGVLEGFVKIHWLKELVDYPEVAEPESLKGNDNTEEVLPVRDT